MVRRSTGTALTRGASAELETIVQDGYAEDAVRVEEWLKRTSEEGPRFQDVNEEAGRRIRSSATSLRMTSIR